MRLMKAFAISALLLLGIFTNVFAADNLKLNAKLHYDSDSNDGPLITGDDLNAGVISGKPAYVILYGEGCYNSKRQARRTVGLYEKYKGRVQFVVVDLDKKLSPAQQELQSKYYRGYIPHVVVLNRSDVALYNSSGEVEENVISGFLDKALQ
jgi:hypothetical protein